MHKSVSNMNPAREEEKASDVRKFGQGRESTLSRKRMGEENHYALRRALRAVLGKETALKTR